MSLDQLSQNDKVRLSQFMDSGLKTLQEMEDLKAGLSDLAKNLAEEFDVKPAVLMKALRTAHKASLHKDEELTEQVKAILQATGRG